MKAISRTVAALVVAGTCSTMAACGGAAPEPANATDATEAPSGDESAQGEEPKKDLKAMKGNRMEKAGAEE